MTRAREAGKGFFVVAEQMVQSAEGLNQRTKNVTKNSCTVAEGAEKLEKESKELMDRVSKFKV